MRCSATTSRSARHDRTADRSRRSTPRPRSGPVRSCSKAATAASRSFGPAMPTALWDAVKGHDHIWTYMSCYGPFADATTFSRLGREPHPARGPLLLRRHRTVRRRRRHRDTDGHPARRALGRGRAHRLFAGAAAHAARHRGAVSARALRLRDARQPPLRMEMQRAQRPVAAGGVALRLRVRRRAAPASIAKGRSRDTAYYSMLDSEWPARKAAFERWLAPDNFDATGRQKTSLAALNGSRLRADG